MSIKVGLAQFVGVEERERSLQSIEALLAQATDEFRLAGLVTA